MSISLQKGQKVSLKKDNVGLSKIIIGLGWDEAQQGGGMFSSRTQKIDCDASAILLTNGRFMGKDDVVYFGNLCHKSGAVMHTGDNRTGAGSGDDEQIIVELNRLPQGYDKIVIVANIYQARERGSAFRPY